VNSLVEIKAFLKKAWAWLKAEWWLPVGLLLLLIGYTTGIVNTGAIKEMFIKRNKSHEEEVKVIEKQREEEREIIKMSAEAQKALAEKFAEDKEKLTREHKKEIKKLAEEARVNKDEFGRKFAEKFGLEFRS